MDPILVWDCSLFLVGCGCCMLDLSRNFHLTFYTYFTHKTYIDCVKVDLEAVLHLEYTTILALEEA